MNLLLFVSQEWAQILRVCSLVATEGTWEVEETYAVVPHETLHPQWYGEIPSGRSR